MRWIQLSVSCHLQNVHIILFHAVVLLESHHFNNLQPTILLHAVNAEWALLVKFLNTGKHLPLTCICVAQTIKAHRSLRHC